VKKSAEPTEAWRMKGSSGPRNPDVKDIKNLIPNAPHLHALFPLTLHFGTATGIETGFL